MGIKNCEHVGFDVDYYQLILLLFVFFAVSYQNNNLIHTFCLIRHQLLHFLTNLWSYVTDQVIFADWKSLEIHLEEGLDLTLIEQKHIELLNSVLRKLFLEGSWKKARVIFFVVVRIFVNMSPPL